MQYKEPHLEAQLSDCPNLLRQMAIDFMLACEELGKPAIVTRVSDPVEGESGVHRENRAVDFRDEHAGVRLFTDAEVETLLARINEKYPRRDGRKTLLHHSFGDGPKHWHLQAPVNLEKGIVWTRTKSSLWSELLSFLSRALFSKRQ